MASHRIHGDHGHSVCLLLLAALGPNIVSVLCTWMHLLSKPTWLWVKRECECVKIGKLYARKMWCERHKEGGLSVCVRDRASVCTSWDPNMLSQILIPFLLKEREELGNFYLFNGSVVWFFLGRNMFFNLSSWKYHSRLYSTNNSFLVSSPPVPSRYSCRGV